MSGQIYTHIVAVGACYIDTILTVPVYPPEDAKQRASSVSKRRGGNCPNTLEVLQQLPCSQITNGKDDEINNESTRQAPELVLLSTLPAGDSSDTRFVVDSFNSNSTTIETTSPASLTTKLSIPSNNVLPKRPVNLVHTFYRQKAHTAASSYIVQSQSTNSRTIVNYNALDEMTLSEFQDAVSALLSSDSASSSNQGGQKTRLWFHFEGRIPETTVQCIRWLRQTFRSSSSIDHSIFNLTTSPEAEVNVKTRINVTISVECEKPARPGLEDLATHADVVFYSRSWAEGKGHQTAEKCLAVESKRIARARKRETRTGTSRERARKIVLCCTWGEKGASVAEVELGEARDENEVEPRYTYASTTLPSWTPVGGPLEIVDTIGAGDTWIAGMLFSLTSRPHWDRDRRVRFANELAGRKIMRDGFDGLGEEMRGEMDW